MEAICIRECTIPGRGLVEVGEGIAVSEADLSAPWLKHFEVQGQSAAAVEPQNQRSGRPHKA